MRRLLYLNICKKSNCLQSARFCRYLFLFFLLFTSSFLNASPLRVGIVEGAPFAMRDIDKVPRGIAVDLWEEIARRNQIPYEFTQFSVTTDEVLDLLYNHQLDLVIGPISVTYDRIQKLDFTISYFNNKVGVIVQKDTSYLWKALVSFFHSSFMLMVFLLIVAFLLYVSIVWIFEREKHKELPEKYIHALVYVFWMHIFHKHYILFPHSKWGKAAGLIWVTCTTLLLASLTASLASYYFMVLQLNNGGITKTSDLHNKVLAAIKGRYEYDVAKSVSSSVVPVKNIQEGLDMIKAGKVFGFVHDQYTAGYELAHRDNASSFVVLNIALDHQPLAFAVRYGDPLRVTINRTITQLDQENMGLSICTPYLGDNATECEF